MYKIEKKVPLPKHSGQGRHATEATMTAGAMEIGDSVVVPNRQVASCIGNWGKRQQPERRFTMRNTDKKFRVWRVT